MKFRKLRADEIDVRISTVGENGVSLLLYKDARVDMNILDETVGSENWQRRHTMINNNLFCDVGIYCNEEWVWKQDVGTESYTEKEKGQASDAFKRACFNWGIGRELYTAPFIFVEAGKCTVKKNDNGKFVCYDRFSVSEIGYDDNGNINRLVIKKKGEVVFVMGEHAKKTISKKEAEILLTTLTNLKNENGESVNIEKVYEMYGVKTFNELTPEQYAKILRSIGK